MGTAGRSTAEDAPALEDAPPHNEAVAYSKHPLPWALPVPLRVHAHYTRAEIEAAFAVLTNDAPWIHREGVLWH